MADGRGNSRQKTKRQNNDIRAWLTAIGAIAVPVIAAADLILRALFGR